MTNNVGDRRSESLGEEKFQADMKSPNSSISVDLSLMKQLDEGTKGCLGCGDNELAPLGTNGGDKRNSGHIKKEKDDEEMGKRDMQLSDHDKHLRTEKQRRKKMKNLVDELNSLLPKEIPKTNLFSTVDGTISYIKTLQQTLENLKARKQARRYVAPNGGSSTGRTLLSPPVFKTWTASNVSISLCGLIAHISICSSRKPGLLTAVCFVLEKYKVEIVAAQISSDEVKSMLMIHARLQKGFLIEAICKQVALEINNIAMA